MLEIVIPAIIFLVLGIGLMAKKRRRSGAVSMGRAMGTLALGTLADNTLIGTNFAEQNGTREKYLISADIIATMKNHTGGEGPIAVGVAHGDYSDAEIEAWFENANTFSENDLVNQEVRKRKCRQVGVFSGLSTDEVLNDGKPIRVPLRFVWGDSQYLKLWAYNYSDGTLTTGSIVDMNAQIYYRRVK